MNGPSSKTLCISTAWVNTVGIVGDGSKLHRGWSAELDISSSMSRVSESINEKKEW
jgi:hypothetical protein